MTAKESERLALVEQRQIDMAFQISEIRAEMKINTKDTKDIKTTLDNLSGGKQALMWATGFIVSIALVVAAFIKGR